MNQIKLPSFKFPPVSEVVFGIQFEQLPYIPYLQIAQLHNLYIKEFPHVQEQPLLPSVFENLSSEPPPLFPLLNIPSLPRLWFIQENGHRLIQFQNDRFVFNWRRAVNKGNEDYPRYNSLFKEFVTHCEKFLNFCSENQLVIDINQIELSYINTIDCDQEDFTKLMHKVFKFWQDESPESPLGNADNQGFNISYPLYEGDALIGRIRVTTNTLMHHSGEKILQIAVTCRGLPKNRKFSDVQKFMNIAHSKIVTGFEYLTTEEMHKVWGKE